MREVVAHTENKACWGWGRNGEKKGRDGATIYPIENKKAYLN